MAFRDGKVNCGKGHRPRQDQANESFFIFGETFASIGEDDKFNNNADDNDVSSRYFGRLVQQRLNFAHHDSSGGDLQENEILAATSGNGSVGKGVGTSRDVASKTSAEGDASLPSEDSMDLDNNPVLPPGISNFAADISKDPTMAKRSNQKDGPMPTDDPSKNKKAHEIVCDIISPLCSAIDPVIGELKNMNGKGAYATRITLQLIEDILESLHMDPNRHPLTLPRWFISRNVTIAVCGEPANTAPLNANKGKGKYSNF